MDDLCVDEYPGGHLASIHSRDEEQALFNTWKVDFDALIGILKIYDNWIWSDGTQVNYTNWAGTTIPSMHVCLEHQKNGYESSK